MKAQVLYGINDLRYESDYKNPVLKDNEVLVKVKACGICGSDIGRVLKSGTYHFPTIIGHEFSGEVVGLAKEEQKKWLNKRVSVFPLIPCRKCKSCLNEDYQLCENYNYLGSRCDGGFAEFVAVPEWNLLEIPDEISFEEAAMFEPAAVAVHALRKAGNISGKHIAITGTGTIASILIQVCISQGAEKVYVLGRNKAKSAYLKNLFPQAVFLNTEDSDLDAQISDYVKNGFDLAIEGTGNSRMMELLFNFSARNATIVSMGNPSDSISFTQKGYWNILRRELTLKGTWNSSYGISGKNDWKEVLELLLNKKLNLQSLITHRLQLKELLDGIHIMNDKKELYNKIMVINE